MRVLGLELTVGWEINDVEILIEANHVLYMALYTYHTEESRNQGIKESRNQGIKESRNQEIKESRNQGIKDSCS